jgi:hypothetical protein
MTVVVLCCTLLSIAFLLYEPIFLNKKTFGFYSEGSN